jgi:cytosine/adenosine deaminase-related metal-dependent hydrolase
MFRRRRGHLFDWLAQNGRDMSDCGRTSPIRHLERAGLLSNHFLAVHANYLGPGDAQLLARSGASVVHCPRSRAYFRHDAFPLARLRRADVNVCLGTDSLASVIRPRGHQLQLNMFEEMRALADEFKALSPRRIIEMATLAGARALGLARKVGELGRGAFADAIAVPFTGKAANVWDGVLAHRGDVLVSLINGCWALNPALKEYSRE